MNIEVDDSARSYLADVGYDPSLGARPLRRAVQQLVEDPLSEKILNGELISGDTVKVGYDEKELTFEIEHGSDRDSGEASAAAAAAVSSTASTPDVI